MGPTTIVIALPQVDAGGVVKRRCVGSVTAVVVASLLVSACGLNFEGVDQWAWVCRAFPRSGS